MTDAAAEPQAQAEAEKLPANCARCGGPFPYGFAFGTLRGEEKACEYYCAGCACRERSAAWLCIAALRSCVEQRSVSVAARVALMEYDFAVKKLGVLGFPRERLHFAERVTALREIHPREHCDGDCMICGVLYCPHAEPLHFRGDGCPACVQDEPAPTAEPKAEV